MTPERAAALEWVAEAAAEVRRVVGAEEDEHTACIALWLALDALSSLPAEPEPGEMVEVRGAVCRNPNSGLYYLTGSQKKDGTWILPAVSQKYIATIVARIPKPVVPVVPVVVAEVI